MKPLVSIIIVSYNAKYYLNLTLSCLAKIAEKIAIEVIVVDNNSELNEIEFNINSFPQFLFIRNKDNLGFSKANNLGVKESTSDNILILNPDTIISDLAISKAIELMNSSSSIGAVAIKMLDGKGHFLPESIRSFPNLKSSFYKLVGLEAVSGYYSDMKESNSIEAMSGACIFFKKNVYEEIGGFDERYFMYGEDIDISYTLKLKGYESKYIEDTEIIHFKGKSSIKSNWKYQNSFYNAMYLYWNKFYNLKGNIFLNFIVTILLFGLKLLSFLKHTISQVLLPCIDFIGIYSVSAILSYCWAIYIKHDNLFFPIDFYVFILPLYTIGSIISNFIYRFYSYEIDISRLIKSSFLNCLVILLIYFALPSDYKYSRAVIIYFAFVSFLIPVLIRWVYSKVSSKPILFSNSHQLMSDIMVSDAKLDEFKSFILSNSNLKFIQNSNSFSNLVVDINDSKPIDLINLIKNQSKTIWLYSSTNQYLIESQGKNSLGYIVANDTNLSIEELSSRFSKRIFDIVISIAFLFLGLCTKLNYFKYAYQSILIIVGNKTWISSESPKSKPGAYVLPSNLADDYRRNYSIKMDFYYTYRLMFIS